MPASNKVMSTGVSAHHFYPLLFYFRFEEPLYAVSRFSFVLLVATLEANFPTARPEAGDGAEPSNLRRSYLAATRTLANAAIAVREDGVEAYVAARQECEPLVRRIAPARGYAMPEIDRRHPAVETVAANGLEHDERMLGSGPS